MDAEAEGAVDGRVGGIETEEIGILLEAEANVVELFLCERGHVSCEVVPNPDQSIQAEFRARLGTLALGNRRIVESGNEYTGTDANVWLQPSSWIPKHQIEKRNCHHAEIDAWDFSR